MADKIADEAKRQRDEAVKNAEEMHDNVVKEAKEQAKEHVNEVDWETGEVKTKWQGLKKWFVDNPIIRKIRTVIEESTSRDSGFNRTLGRNAHGTNFWRGGLTWVGEQGPELIDLPKGTKVHSNQKSMNMMKNKMEHTGTIKVVGVNNNDEFVGVVDMVMEQLRREVRS